MRAKAKELLVPRLRLGTRSDQVLPIDCLAVDPPIS
jgi:hypothetical protein